MTISVDKAIKLLEEILSDKVFKALPSYNEALKLGIEALKYVKMHKAAFLTVMSDYYQERQRNR